MDSESMTVLMIVPILMLIMVICLTLLLVVLPFWKICKKAGFKGELSLLMLVPIGNIILPFYLAFAEWPARRTPGQTPAIDKD